MISDSELVTNVGSLYKARGQPGLKIWRTGILVSISLLAIIAAKLIVRGPISLETQTITFKSKTSAKPSSMSSLRDAVSSSEDAKETSPIPFTTSNVREIGRAHV